MSTLADLALAAQRYQRKRSHSPPGSDSSSSSGYGSILSEDEVEALEPQDFSPQGTLTNHLNSTNKNVVESYDGEHRRLDITNKGMKLLMKMGWTEGSGLGATENGRKDPIPTPAQTPLLGLGKATQDAYMLSNAISKPRELESLVIARETEEDRTKREQKVRVVQLREEEREDRLKTFHCAICDKGYTTISQFEEHERSYAHHHARRALEAKQARKAGKPSAEARLEKERKREAKELERMARAAGMTVASAPPSATHALPKSDMMASAVPASGYGFKKVGGWAPAAAGTAGLSKPTSGWSLVSNQDNTDGTNNAGASKFKPGFAPISTPASQSSHASLSGFRAIQAGSETANSQTLFTRAPAFVASSSASTSFQPTPSQTLAGDKTSEAAPAPKSKFAQIAARLAAQRAAGVLGPPKTASAPKLSTDADSDLERMLDGSVYM